MTDTTPTIAPGTLPGRARATRRPTTAAERSRVDNEQPANNRPRPTVDSEPRRIPGLEVTALEYQSDPAIDRLDLQLVPPRQHPGKATTNPTNRRQTPPITSGPPYQSTLRPNGERRPPSAGSPGRSVPRSQAAAAAWRRGAAMLRLSRTGKQGQMQPDVRLAQAPARKSAEPSFHSGELPVHL
jgi:hypothetical protein